MPSRSLVSSARRPLSAIFLGSLPPKDPKEANIPDLPDPPRSPGAVTASGLPSPPATNSTSSGSTGDNGSNNSGSIRQRPVSYSGPSGNIMPSETYEKSIAMSKTSRPNSDDEDDENDHAGEEDMTARLDLRFGVRGPNENIAALQRVKSLAQRNRMVSLLRFLLDLYSLYTLVPPHVVPAHSRQPSELGFRYSNTKIYAIQTDLLAESMLDVQALDKLSSRLHTPSPTRTSRSPNAPPSSISTTSTSRLSSHSHSQSAPQIQRSDTLSGSETERESLRAPTPSRSDSNSNSYRSTSPERPSTPPLASNSRPRRRLTSAPGSPKGTRQASPGPSRTPRKRVSMASALSGQSLESGVYTRNDSDITEAALAAVASSRRSPTGIKKARQPLPREFRDRDRRSLDGHSSMEPMTPHQEYDGPSPRTAAHTSSRSTTNVQYSPRSARSTRFSTVRDLARRHQTRWLSDDLSGNPNPPDGGRRQSQRGGSAESALNGSIGVTGRLAGESLRAAGIGMRTTGSGRHGASEDVFADGRVVDISARGGRSTAVDPSANRSVEWEDRERQQQLDGHDRAQMSGGNSGPPVPRPHLHSDPSRAPTDLVTDTRGIARSRPSTSMADFSHAENGSRNGGYSVQSRRTTYDHMDRPESRHSPATRTTYLSQTPLDLDRPRTSASVSARHTSVTPSGKGTLASLNNPQNAEHTRLMLESLSMFQAQLSRLPNQSSAVRDLSEHSSAIIRASERLNKILRAATTNAVQQQIAIEVDDEYYEADGHNHLAHIWRDVGSDFRESLRESDDMVRSLTGFILGVGKVLKEASGAPESAHMRSISLADESRPPSDPGIERSSSRRSQDGRRSTESRLSWEPLTSARGADVSRRLSSRSDLNLSRPPSARDRDSASDQDRSTSSRSGLGPMSASRRLFAPREHREQQIVSNGSATHDSPSNALDLSLEYEPSPTPASRHHLAERSKQPAYSTPPPLPTLPSESLLQKSRAPGDTVGRRNVSLASIATIRTPNPPYSLSTPNPTTAVSAHTVTTSPETSTFPIQRTDSRDSVRSSITFSRPSGVSVSSLQQQQNRDEVRRRMGTASEEESPNVNQVRSPLSGSETERDTRRRTLGIRAAARASLGVAVEERGTGENNVQPRTITFPSQRERRRTVTEIFT